jgi:DNA-binding NarL/FixJ family response regulator
MRKLEEALLSKRELECLGYFARGYTIKIIAVMLGLSSRTVEYYLQITKRKLNRYTKIQLIESYWKYFNKNSEYKKMIEFT